MSELFQRSYNPDEPLFSCHIPKCGGQSLSAVMRSWFNEAFLEHYYDDTKGVTPAPHVPRSGSVIQGHFSDDMAIERMYPTANQFITVIRDPFDIVVSNYFYLKKAALDWLVKPNIPGSLEAYMEEALADRFDLVFNFLPLRAAGKDMEDFIRTTFLFVGLFEDYQASLDRLATLLAKPRVTVPHHNQSNRDEEVPNLREAFRSVYREEYEFFDLVRADHEQWRRLLVRE